MSLAAGQTFFAPFPLSPGDVEHLFFIISDPGLDVENVVIVPLMTWDEYKEQTCVLEAKDHPFIRHRSYIDFGCAMSLRADAIDKAIRCKEFRGHKPASPGLLEKIRNGAAASDFLPLGLRYILEQQGIVGPE